MDVISLIVSLNKISLIAFLLTSGFLAYQFYLLKKEINNRKEKLRIPDFKEGQKTNLKFSEKIISVKEQKVYKKHSFTPLIIGIIMFLFFGIFFAVGYINSKKTSENLNNNSIISPVINFVASKGIKIYNKNWQELSDSDISKLSPNETLIIAIETIKDSDIDLARIRINKNKWEEEDITFNFNKEKNVFYREYKIGTNESFLKIEAQLHSKVDGWLGD